MSKQPWQTAVDPFERQPERRGVNVKNTREAIAPLYQAA